MKERVGLTAVALIACLAGVPVLAQDAAPVPDLTGTWNGTYKLIRWDGGAEGVLELRVLEQDGPLLKAEKAWALAPGGTPGDVGGELHTKATEPLVGVIDFDGQSLYLTEQGDGGTYTGRLTDPDTIELVYFEAGHQATAYRMVLKRTQ